MANGREESVGVGGRRGGWELEGGGCTMFSRGWGWGFQCCDYRVTGDPNGVLKGGC